MASEQVTPLPHATTAKPQVRETTHLFALVLAPPALIATCQALNGEMLAFWQSRLKDGLATGARLVECTSFDSALEIQLDYAKATLQACLDQSARITGLMMRALAGDPTPQPVPELPDERASALAA